VILFSAVLAAHAFAQESPTSHTGSVTPLSELLAEQRRTIHRLKRRGEAGKRPSKFRRRSRRSPTTITLQHLSVGSPRPFAATPTATLPTSASASRKDIPYPGKLKLRGEIAKREADVSQQQVESARRAVLAEVKASYFQLAYLSQTLAILQSDGELLKQIEQAADARYRSGMGRQQDLLQAQLQKEARARDCHAPSGSWQLQAQLKQFLNRAQDSPDIEPPISRNLLSCRTIRSFSGLPRRKNPELAASQK